MSIRKIFATLPLSLVIAACSGGGPTSDPTGTAVNPGVSCTGQCATATTALTVTDVQTIIAQAVAEAQAQNTQATIAVTDRVGNVLGVYRMGNPANRVVQIATVNDVNTPAVIDSGLEGIKLPVASTQANIDDQAAISKAVTGAYLSSEGNAFSTRTASLIIQENFNPGEMGAPGGPLFGVQFSSLSCSDFTTDAVGVTTGPKRTPLGLSADPGGLPLYKNGTVVGGIGVMADGAYSLDKIISDNDRNLDEMIAYAGTFNYAAPVDRMAGRITVEGKTFRFSDVGFADLSSDLGTATFNNIPAGTGNLIPVTGYSNGNIVAGTAFGQPASGIRSEQNTFPANLDAFVFVDGNNNNRYPAKAGTDNLAVASLSQLEVQTIMQEALRVANRARGQIRRPQNSQARVTISVVDTAGEILGMVRTRDAPVFGADVSLQKARTASFFSSPGAANFLNTLPDAKYITIPDVQGASITQKAAISMGGYVTDLRTFVGDQTALTGGVAFSDRAGGNLSRPFYPDGLTSSNMNGPLSKQQGSWSIFSTGMQLDMIMNAVLQHVLFTATGGGPGLPDVTNNCAGVNYDVPNTTFTSNINTNQMANGSQIFPGSVPIYRGNTLVGGIGISGDGVDQDDMIAFLGVDNASNTDALQGSIGNAPMAMRSDTLMPMGYRLRFVQCPQSPFLDNGNDNVCSGK